jgi:hypothetical protein
MLVKTMTTDQTITEIGNTTDSHCWLSGQASVGFLPLAENKVSSRNGYAQPFQMWGFQTYGLPRVPPVRCGIRPSIPSPLTLISEIHLPAKMVAGLTRHY